MLVLVVRPHVGAVAIAQVLGLFNIVFGISALVTAATNRRSRNHETASVTRHKPSP